VAQRAYTHVIIRADVQATRAYLHAEKDVEAALNKAGWKVVKREMTATNFYFSRLLEAKRA
jgi:magnesium-protoporphyrin O-methyltransferase